MQHGRLSVRLQLERSIVLSPAFRTTFLPPTLTLVQFVFSPDYRRVRRRQNRRPAGLGVPLGDAVRHVQARLPPRPQVQAAEINVRKVAPSGL